MCRRSIELGNDSRAPRANACFLPISSRHDFVHFNASLCRA
jgi:hypothetical protein